MIIKHKKQCIQNEITTIKTSPESHLHWKNHLHKSPLYFRVYADFQADNEIDNSSTGKKQLKFISKVQYVMVMK